MPTKTKTNVVHDCGPVRSDLQSSDSWTAPARPTGKGRTTPQEGCRRAGANDYAAFLGVFASLRP
jgi:hypothetical protein